MVTSLLVDTDSTDARRQLSRRPRRPRCGGPAPRSGRRGGRNMVSGPGPDGPVRAAGGPPVQAPRPPALLRMRRPGGSPPGGTGSATRAESALQHASESRVSVLRSLTTRIPRACVIDRTRMAGPRRCAVWRRWCRVVQWLRRRGAVAPGCAAARPLRAAAAAASAGIAHGACHGARGRGAGGPRWRRRRGALAGTRRDSAARASPVAAGPFAPSGIIRVGTRDSEACRSPGAGPDGDSEPEGPSASASRPAGQRRRPRRWVSWRQRRRGGQPPAPRRASLAGWSRPGSHGRRPARPYATPPPSRRIQPKARAAVSRPLAPVGRPRRLRPCSGAGRDKRPGLPGACRPRRRTTRSALPRPGPSLGWTRAALGPAGEPPRRGPRDLPVRPGLRGEAPAASAPDAIALLCFVLFHFGPRAAQMLIKRAPVSAGPQGGSGT